MKIETHPKLAGCYFVSGDDNEFIAELHTNSWDDFEKSIHSITKAKYREGKKWADKLADYFLHNLRREFFDLIPLTYLWTLKSGYIEIAHLYETRIFPHIAHKISIREGRRWLFSYDSMIEPDNRVEFYKEWLTQTQFVTQHDRIERLVALHGLRVFAEKMSRRARERVHVMYLEFIKQEENKDIEKTFGELIEADVKDIKRSIVAEKIDKKEMDFEWSLNNWLMRRYAVKEVLGKYLFCFIVLFSLICFGTIFCLAIFLSNNSQPYYNLYTIFSFLSIPIFIFFWIKGGWRLSKVIWGTAVGWFLIFSAALADLMYQKFAKEQPQLLNLQWKQLVAAVIIFVGIFSLIIWWEIKEAEIKPRAKQLYRLLSISAVSIFFGIIEGSILVALVSWYLPEIGCWFNRWTALVLTLGNVQAVTLGVITQLIWESRRLTEIVRK